MKIFETPLTDRVLNELISMSGEWEKENSCHGYRKNTKSDIEPNRIFLAEQDGKTVGYLFGHIEKSKEKSSIMEADVKFFEIEELYVSPSFRNKGIGRTLFEYVEDAVKSEADYILLSTATKDHRAILHFYIDEMGMDFWSARLFKKL